VNSRFWVTLCRRWDVDAAREGKEAAVTVWMVERAEVWVGESRIEGEMVEGEGVVWGRGGSMGVEEGGRRMDSHVWRSVWSLGLEWHG